jgi:pimeloyl-ACP methyl ester carboxylesterase
MREIAPASQPFIELPDGRRLTYSSAGPDHGRPVLYMHGAIGSPVRRSVALEQLTTELGVRYLMVNRPGFAGSDLAPGRTIRSFAADVGELADALALERFAIVGVSAGGPYALACAHELGERVTGVAACSSLSPLCAPHATPGMRKRIRAALLVLAHAPRLCSGCGDAALPLLRRNPGLLRHIIAIGAARADREVIADPVERRAAVDSFIGATAAGVRGMVEDYLVYSRAWGFSPAAINTEVHVWHGMADALVPVEHALQLAASLQSCRAFFDPDEGHHFFRRRLAAILGVLVRRAPAPPVFAGRATTR